MSNTQIRASTQRETLRGYKNRITECCAHPPFMYDCINDVVSSYASAQIHLQDNYYFNFFFRYNLQEIYSLYKFDGLSEDWNKEYFIYNILCRGWIAMVKANTYGWIPQACVFGGTRDVFGFPLTVLINNGWFDTRNNETEYTLNDNAYIIKMTPDYMGVVNICAFYAEKMALLFSTFDNSALLSKNGYFITGSNKATIRTISEALESLLNGDIAVKLQAPINPETRKIDGLDILETDIRKHYIINDLMKDMLNLIDMFHADIGFPTVNRTKAERLIVAEQAAQNSSVTIKSDLWYECLKDSIDKFNKASGYSISVEKRYDPEEIVGSIKTGEGGEDNGTDNSTLGGKDTSDDKNSKEDK